MIQDNRYYEKDIHGRHGMFCTGCGTVFYVAQVAIRYEIIRNPCPYCDGMTLYITDEDQPIDEEDDPNTN